MGNETIHAFDSSAAAWAFMRLCDKQGHSAGYPSLSAPYTVRVIAGPRTSPTVEQVAELVRFEVRS